MRSLILLLILSAPAHALKCQQYEKVAEYLNTQKFIKASREHRLLKKEPVLNLGDINQARAITYEFPALKEFGFGVPGKSGWTKYISRHPQSIMKGKKVGWEIKNENGHARVRLDWDREKGAHYNIEITRKDAGKSETHKLAVSFLCGKVKCSEEQYGKIASRLE